MSVTVSPEILYVLNTSGKPLSESKKSQILDAINQKSYIVKYGSVHVDDYVINSHNDLIELGDKIATSKFSIFDYVVVVPPDSAISALLLDMLNEYSGSIEFTYVAIFENDRLVELIPTTPYKHV